PKPGSTWTVESSGPRWAMARDMTSTSEALTPRGSRIPTKPHIGRQEESVRALGLSGPVSSARSVGSRRGSRLPAERRVIQAAEPVAQERVDSAKPQRGNVSDPIHRRHQPVGHAASAPGGGVEQKDGQLDQAEKAMAVSQRPDPIEPGLVEERDGA